MSVPPLFFAAIRFLGIALILLPFLRPIPENLSMLFLISMGMGALHFAFLFSGLANAEASAVAIVGQLGVPISTLLSMIFLSEKIGWRRGIGIVLAFAGAVVIAFNPESFSLSWGLVYVALAALVASVSGILMKRMKPVSALQMQAWIGLFSFAPLFLFSALLERDSAAYFLAGGAGVYAALIFGILGVSIFAHGAFYNLIKKYDISFLSPLTLMTPVWGVVLSVWLLSEPLSARLITGAIISLSGVMVILLRTNHTWPEAVLGMRWQGLWIKRR